MRENFIESLKHTKRTIYYSVIITKSWVGDECSDDFNDLDATDLISSIDEESFPIKLAGFFPQHTSRNVNDGGRPTEIGL